MTFEDAVRWLKNGKYISSLEWLDTKDIKNPQLRITKVNLTDELPKVVGGGKYLRLEKNSQGDKIVCEHASWQSRMVDGIDFLEASLIAALGDASVSTEDMMRNDW